MTFFNAIKSVFIKNLEKTFSVLPVSTEILDKVLLPPGGVYFHIPIPSGRLRITKDDHRRVFNTKKVEEHVQREFLISYDRLCHSLPALLPPGKGQSFCKGDPNPIRSPILFYIRAAGFIQTF